MEREHVHQTTFIWCIPVVEMTVKGEVLKVSTLPGQILPPCPRCTAILTVFVRVVRSQKSPLKI